MHVANWKLLVENVLECYHCSTVHKNTLVPIGMGFLDPQNHFSENMHDTIDYPLLNTDKQVERNKKLSFLDKRKFIHNSFRHFFIFPNLFISSTDGILFYIGRLDPLSVNQTNLLVSFHKPVFDDLAHRENVLIDLFYNEGFDSFFNVILEDKKVLENIQSNLISVPKETQIFGNQENRVSSFHKSLQSIINY